MSWNEVMQDNSTKEVEFVKTPVGVTTLRLVTSEPKAVWKHWIPQANAGKGMSVVCGEGCPICKINDELQKQGLNKKYTSSRAFAMVALVNENGEKKLKVFEKGKGVFQDLYNLSQSMGALDDYEINITRTGTKMNDTKYTVLPKMPMTPMTAEEEKFVKENMINLDEVYKVLPKDKIEKLLEGGSLIDEEQKEENPQFEVE